MEKENITLQGTIGCPETLDIFKQFRFYIFYLGFVFEFFGVVKNIF